jgi:hypothetical protein
MKHRGTIRTSARLVVVLSVIAFALVIWIRMTRASAARPFHRTRQARGLFERRSRVLTCRGRR